MGEKREGLLLAHSFDVKKHLVGGHFLSEKLDGERCFWDSGITIGQPATSVPWAFKPKPNEIATGLWTRNFKVIHAPMTWVEKLPRGIFLDGELFLGRGRFQELMSIVRTEINPNPFLWSKVKYRLFDQPAPQDVFAQGRMRIRGEDFMIGPNSLEYVRKYITQLPMAFEFRNTVDLLKNIKSDVCEAEDQILLPSRHAEALFIAREKLGEIIELGGEGIMLRAERSRWYPKRSNFLLKFKEFYDSEATVLGVFEGKGRHFERMGGLYMEWINPKGDKVAFELGGGFTDEEREYDYVKKNFSPGTKVTFRFLNLTDSGLPSKASYHRKRVEE